MFIQVLNNYQLTVPAEEITAVNLLVVKNFTVIRQSNLRQKEDVITEDGIDELKIDGLVYLNKIGQCLLD